MLGLKLSPQRGKWVLLAAGILLTGSGQAVLADSMAYAGTGTGEFGTLDLNTGTFSDLGNSGQTLAGMGVANGTLYGVNYRQAVGILYSINTANGSLTNIGSSSVYYYDFGSTTTGLYAVGKDLNLYSVDPTNGAARLIGATGIGGFGQWSGLSTNAETLYLSNGNMLYTLNTNTGAASLVGSLGGAEYTAMVLENGSLWGGQSIPALAVGTLNLSTGAITSTTAITGINASNVWSLAPVPLPTAVPVPASIWLFGSALAGFIGVKRRKSLQN
jgi:hypothetical protein